MIMDSLNNENTTPRYRSLTKLILMTLCYNLSTVYFIYACSYFSSISYQSIKDIYSIGMQQGFGQGVIVGSVNFGAGIGSFLIYPILNFFSRRKIFLFLNICAGISGAVILFKNEASLIIGRIMQGIVAGACSAFVPIMVNEINPKSITHTMGSLQNVLFSFGNLLPFLLSYLLSFGSEEKEYWLVIFAFVPFVIIVLQQILILFLVDNETPKYLIIERRDDEAKQLISEIYKTEYQLEVYEQKVKDLEIENECQYRVYPSDNIKAIILAFSILIFHPLNGVGIVILYSNELIADVMPDLKLSWPVILLLSKLIFSLLGSFLVYSISQRKQMLFGVVGQLFALLGIFIGFKNKYSQYGIVLTLISQGLLIIIFITTVGAISFYYVSQILQPTLVPYSFLCFWIMSTIVVTVFPIVRQNYENKNCPEFFLFLAFCMLLEFFICYFLMVETKKKTEKQIKDNFQAINIFT